MVAVARVVIASSEHRVLRSQFRDRAPGADGLLWWVVLRRRARSAAPVPRDPDADARGRALLNSVDPPASG
jgi:hypothetical protein